MNADKVVPRPRRSVELIINFFSWREDFSSRHRQIRGELANGGVKRGQDRGDDAAAGSGELVAVRAAHLADQAVSPQQAQTTGDPGGTAAVLALVASRSREEHRLQVAIAKPVQGKRASADRFQQNPIVLKRSQRAHSAALPSPGFLEAG